MKKYDKKVIHNLLNLNFKNRYLLQGNLFLNEKMDLA